MKCSLILICLIIYFSTIKAQHQQIFVEQAFEWQEFDSGVDQIARDNVIRRVLQEPAFGRIKNISFESISNNFHFLDLNGDKELDVVYNGGYGGENDIIYLVIFQKNQLIVSDPLFGRITDFSVLEKKVEIKIYDYGCCAQLVDVYSKHEVFFGNGEFEFNNLYAYGRIKESQKPDEFFKEIRFEVQNDEYKLRAQPEIMNDYGGVPEEVLIDGNTLAIYPKYSTGTAIAQKIDPIGRLWWFVIMDDNIEPKRSLLIKRNNNGVEYKSTGWMSSRFLTVKN